MTTMRKSDQQGPLDPIEQESILFHNEQIIAVKDEIPASRWQEVEQWFKRQMPGQELPPTQEKLF